MTEDEYEKFSHKVDQMLEMQDFMNKKVHPEWKDQDFPWYRAAVIEASEMIDHLGWKWWKHQEPDIDQAKLELVDIWHFCLSDCLSKGINIESKAYHNGFKNMSHYASTSLIDYIEAFQQCTLEYEHCHADYIPIFLDKLDMTFDELFKLYMAKNVLNLFRQDNGYKEGGYIKMWNGREDNEVLMEVLEGLDTDSKDFKDDLYSSLDDCYKEAKCKI